MEVLVEYGGRRKLIREKDGRHVLIKSLEEFGLPVQEGVMAEIWNDQWKTWLVMSDVMEIQTKSKIRISTMTAPDPISTIEYMSASTSAPAVHTLHSATTASVDFVVDKDASRSSTAAPVDFVVDKDESCDDAQATEPEKVLGLATLSESASSVHSTPDVASPPGTIQASATRTGNCSEGRRRAPRSTPWTAVVERVSMSCKSALHGHTPISESHWSDLMTCWYEFTTESSFYPDSGDYRKWATDLVDLFGPAVRGRPTLYESIDYVQGKMRMKMKNERYKSMDKRLEDERERKKVRQPKKKILESMGIPNYDPVLKKTTDEAAAVGAMFKLKNVQMPDADKEKLKADTFALRRSMMLSNGTQLAELRYKFPWLFEEKELWKEFHRVCGEERHNMAERKLDEIISTVKQKVFSENEEETVAAFCSLFGAGCSAERGGGLTVQGGVLHLNDGEVCPLSGGRTRHVLVWTAAHTVFAVKPASHNRELVLFLQEICFGIKEKKRTPKAASVLLFLNMDAETEG